MQETPNLADLNSVLNNLKFENDISLLQAIRDEGTPTKVLDAKLTLKTKKAEYISQYISTSRLEYNEEAVGYSVSVTNAKNTLVICVDLSLLIKTLIIGDNGWQEDYVCEDAGALFQRENFDPICKQLEFAKLALLSEGAVLLEAKYEHFDPEWTEYKFVLQCKIENLSSEYSLQFTQ